MTKPERAVSVVGTFDLRVAPVEVTARLTGNGSHVVDEPEVTWLRLGPRDRGIGSW